MVTKKLKSIELTSFTIMGTGINTLFSIISALILIIATTALIPNSFSVMIYVLPTIVFGTIIISIFHYFATGYLYNILSKKLKTVTFDIEEDGRISKISALPTALMMAIISLIMFLVIYLSISLILPILLSSMIQILMFTGQTPVAYILYQAYVLLSNPMIMGIVVIGLFVLTFISTLIISYIYNILGGSDRGAVVELSNDSDYTVLESINPMQLAIVIAAISLIINIVYAIISIINGAAPLTALTSIFAGLIGGFIDAYLFALFYNFLAPKLGKLKVELEDI